MCRLPSFLKKFKRAILYCFYIVIGFQHLDLSAAQADAKNAKDAENNRRQDSSTTPYNILLILTDQESFELLEAEGYQLPGRNELRQRGVTFHNHYIAAAMCTPSRGTIFTGHPPQVTGICDQMQTGYVPSMCTTRPSLGTIMNSLGYTTAYYGKFELDRDIVFANDKTNYTTALKKYGFDKFEPDGDKTGKPDEGYDTDNYSANESIRWLRTNSQELSKKRQPWFMVLSMINPHDIMYADVNLPEETVQKSKIDAIITPPPDNERYKKKWKFNLWSSLSQPIDAPDRPAGQLQYHLGWSNYLGTIPNTRKDMWTVFYNYYLNLIRDSDRNITQVLDTLDELNLWKNTIIIFTADHGELGGSHGGLRGKGPFPYEQMSNVPLIIVHPDYKGGKSCQAVTSHIDLLPTLVGLSGAASDKKKNELLKGLPGHDFSKLLASPETARIDAVRKGALFNYMGLLTIDSKYLTWAMHYCSKGKFAPSLSEKHPDLNKRGFLNFVVDGRYKYARYFAPNNFNTPKTIEEIFKHNDVELFDLKNDPGEINNLATDPEKYRNLILRMNNLLNELIEKEVGENDGNFLPKPIPSLIKSQ